MATAGKKKGGSARERKERQIKMDKILLVTAQGWSKAAAARAAGTSRNVLNEWLDQHPDFEKAYYEAVEAGTDVLEDVATSRVRRQKSDVLTIFLLKSRRPEKFNPQPDESKAGTLNINIKRF